MFSYKTKTKIVKDEPFSMYIFTYIRFTWRCQTFVITHIIAHLVYILLLAYALFLLITDDIEFTEAVIVVN